MGDGQRKVTDSPPDEPETTYRYIGMVDIAGWFDIGRPPLPAGAPLVSCA
ncbi:hypothetical protein OG738_27325 [Amycolatopsis sp. NBC_01488]|nr:hypothetical protein [Amycolatopsis sp. NBC_01488]